MEKKSRKSATKWSQASERALIAIWKEKIADLRRCRQNTHIVAEMMAEMEKHGFSYKVEELKSKMHNLTVRYRKEKQSIAMSEESPTEWDLYADVDSILGQYEKYNSANVALDSINDINSDISSSALSSSPSSLRLLKVLKKVEESIANINGEMQKTSQKLLEIEEGKKKILQEYVEREIEVQKAVIEYLKRP